MFEVDDIFQDKNILTGYQLTENNTLYRDPFICKHLNMGLVARKPVFGVSGKASFKPVTETS